jgi:hypothetical protein
MGRELVMLLVGELYRTGHFAEAKRIITTYLEDPKDMESSMQRLAAEQAKRGDAASAFATVEELEDRAARDGARLAIAEVYCKAGRREPAKRLTDSVFRRVQKQPVAGREKQAERLAALYGMLRAEAELRALLAPIEDPLLRASCLTKATRGYADQASIP